MFRIKSYIDIFEYPKKQVLHQIGLTPDTRNPIRSSPSNVNPYGRLLVQMTSQKWRVNATKFCMLTCNMHINM